MSIAKTKQWILEQTRFLIAIALAAVIGGVTTASVMAAIPDTDGKIYACYTTGLLARVKIIDNTSQTCGTGETAINWKQNGSPLLANPAGKNLSESVMVYWDLRNLNFTGTNFNVAKLISADLRGSDLTDAQFISALLIDANLSGLRLDGTDFQGAALSGINWSGVTFNNVNINGANLGNDDLSNLSFAGVIGFEGTDFSNSDLDSATLPLNPNFRDSRLYNTKMTNLDLRNANFSGSSLTGADFSGSDITGVIWQDPNGGGQTLCPDGTSAVSNGNTCVGHL